MFLARRGDLTAIKVLMAISFCVNPTGLKSLKKHGDPSFRPPNTSRTDVYSPASNPKRLRCRIFSLSTA